MLMVALATSFGCVAGPGTQPKPLSTARPKASPVAPGVIDAVPAEMIGKTRAVPQGADMMLGDPRFPSVTGKTRFTGKAKLLSDLGAGLVSNNSGSLISDRGGAMIGKTRYSLAQAPEENTLVDARVEVLDTQGQLLVDQAGKPIGASTDAQGDYAFDAALPNEPLVLRIRLFPTVSNALSGGELRALLPAQPGSATREAPLDTASSLGAAYVLDRYVAKRGASLAKLPAAEADALRRDLDAARGALAAKPTYRAAAMADAVEALRTATPQVDTTLKRIEALLLAGLANLGNGLGATAIALGGPLGLAIDGTGQLLVLEGVGGRVRSIDLSAVGAPTKLLAGGGAKAGSSASAQAARFFALDSMVRDADGSLLLTDTGAGKLLRIDPQGNLQTLLDPTSPTPPAFPRSLVRLPDGDLLIGEAPYTRKAGGRLLRMKPSGAISEEPLDGLLNVSFMAMALASDGTLWVLDRNGTNGRILARKPGGSFQVIADPYACGTHAGLLAGPGGSVYFGDALGNRVWRFDADFSKHPIAGTGAKGAGGDGGPALAATFNAPAAMALGADGTLYVADSGNNLVRAIAPDGTIRTVAGTLGATTVGDALNVPINTPGGVAIDPEGRIVVGETVANVIKRLDGGRLEVVAGAGKGDAGDGGPATEALFSSIASLIYFEDQLVIADAGNHRLRRIGKDGVIRTFIGPVSAQSRTPVGLTRTPALETPMEAPIAFAISPADKLFYWSDNGTNQVWRRSATGESELIAGSPTGARGGEGDGGPAAAATFEIPFGIAFDPTGRWLYVADAGNLRVRRIDMLSQDRKIAAFAGVARDEALGRLVGGEVPAASGKAIETLLTLPAALAVDADGSVYVGELGTERLESLGRGVGALGALLPKLPARLRKITQDGMVTTLVGPGGKILTDPTAEDALGIPLSMIFDRQGRLVLSDAGNNQLKLFPQGSF